MECGEKRATVSERRNSLRITEAVNVKRTVASQETQSEVKAKALSICCQIGYFTRRGILAEENLGEWDESRGVKIFGERGGLQSIRWSHQQGKLTGDEKGYLGLQGGEC